MREMKPMGVMATPDGGTPIRRLSLLGMAPDLMTGNLTKIDEDEDDSEDNLIPPSVEELE